MARAEQSAAAAQLGLTLREAHADAVRALRSAGVEEPATDARLLLAAAAGLSRADLVAEPGRVLEPEQSASFASFVERRIGREPVARILGTRAFYGRDFMISAATLDPRPDTEALVDTVLEIVRSEGWADKPVRILDFGTGSGCIIITLLAELPNALGWGVDVSAGALDVAAQNAARMGVAGRLVLATCKSLDEVQGPFDLLVSNPPYVMTGAIDGLEPEVRDFDPRQALDGGPDGLAFQRTIVVDGVRLAPGGWVAIEVGNDQAGKVVELVKSGGSREGAVTTRCDLAGIQRCVAWKTRSSAMR